MKEVHKRDLYTTEGSEEAYHDAYVFSAILSREQNASQKINGHRRSVAELWVVFNNLLSV